MVQWGLGLVIKVAVAVAEMTDADLLLVRGGEGYLPLIVLCLGFYAIHRTSLAWLSIVPLVLAMFIWQTAGRPDLWISQNGKVIAYRDHEQAWQFLGSNRITLGEAGIVAI